MLESLTAIDTLQRPPWTTGYVQGVIDAPLLNLTPGSRMGVVHDERFAAFLESLGELEAALDEIVRRQRNAAEEKSNRDTSARSSERSARHCSHCPKKNMVGLKLTASTSFGASGLADRVPERP